MEFPETPVQELPQHREGEYIPDGHGGIKSDVAMPVLPWAADRGTDDVKGVNASEHGWSPTSDTAVSGVYFDADIDAPVVVLSIDDPVFNIG